MMGDTEAAPASSDVIHIERIELAATRVADALRRALATDDETRRQLVEVLQQLSTLQAQMREWKELHHILHKVLTALSPFYANLRAFGHEAAEPANGRALLRIWRPCQAEVDRLIDLEGRLEYARLSLYREGTGASRPDLGARIASLRREVEERLREEAWSTEGLIDLADELDQTCSCYLTLADWELRRVIEKEQRLCTGLLGGLL
jgi:hypothetical protein